MSVEVNPVGIRCGAKNGGLDCVYCYERCARLAGGDAALPAVDHCAVQAAVLATRGDHFSLHGGEPLLARVEDLEKLWAFGLERFHHNGIQTSGRAITAEHLRLFKKYRVHVGFSIDGPGELNDARRAGTTAETRAASEHSDAMIRRCLRTGISASIIMTLHKINASPARLPRLLAWVRSLAHAGLHSARLHVLQASSGPGRALVLPTHEAIAAMHAFRDLEADLNRPRWLPWNRADLKFDVFDDIRKVLTANDKSLTCVWAACDPWVTASVQGVNPDGTRHGCGRSEDQWLPMHEGPLVRQLALAETPQADGGCQGCRFLIVCKGSCPGAGIGGDWRNRAEDCELWRALIEAEEAALEAVGCQPVTRRPDFPAIEARMMKAWAAGQRPGVGLLIEHPDDFLTLGRRHPGGHGDKPHGDHLDTTRGSR